VSHHELCRFTSADAFDLRDDSDGIPAAFFTLEADVFSSLDVDVKVSRLAAPRTTRVDFPSGRYFG